MKSRKFPYLRWTVAVLIGSAVIGLLTELNPVPAAADSAPQATPVSQYAAAADLLAQVDSYVERITADLADPNRYSAEQQDRVAKDANTLAVLALVLGMHDEPTKLKPAASKLLEASLALADASGNYDDARAALADVRAALEATGGDSLSWKPVGDVVQLMKQVPIVNNNLRRAATSRRFEREIDKITGNAATLAAIAQVTSRNTDYCSSAEDEKRWGEISLGMRDACAEVAAAARKNDPAAAKLALEKIVKTCDACHAEFR